MTRGSLSRGLFLFGGERKKHPDNGFVFVFVWGGREKEPDNGF